MLTRSAYVSWLVSATGLAMVFASPNDDLLVSVGLGLAILGPLIALAAVVRQRTPEAVFVFLVALGAPVLLGIVFYLVARDANEARPSTAVGWLDDEGALGRCLVSAHGWTGSQAQV